jgi:hypothetical protein
MQPVSVLLEQACQQTQPPLDPSKCTLKLGKHSIDLREPIRFLGLPRGAILMLETSTFCSKQCFDSCAHLVDFSETSQIAIRSLHTLEVHEGFEILNWLC